MKIYSKDEVKLQQEQKWVKYNDVCKLIDGMITISNGKTENFDYLMSIIGLNKIHVLQKNSLNSIVYDTNEVPDKKCKY